MLHIFLLIIFHASFGSTPTQKQMQEGTLTAKTITIQTNKKNQQILTANKNVKIKGEDFKILTDQVQVNNQTKFVKIPTPSTIIYTQNNQKTFIFAQSISGLPQNRNITAEDVSLISEIVSFKSQSIHTKNEHFTLQNAKFSTCKMLNVKTQEPCPVPWFGTAKKVKFNQEKNTLKAKHFVLRIHQVPVFYSPYIKFNLNKTKNGWQHFQIVTANNQQGFQADYIINSEILGKFTIRPQIYLTENKLNPQNSLGNNIAFVHEYSKPTEEKIIKSKSEIKIAPNVVGETKDETLTRYYIFHEGTKLNKTSSLHTKLNIASDKSFRQLYNFAFENYLESNISYTKMHQNSFTNFNAINYNPVTVQDTKTIPTLISSINHIHHFEKKPLNFNTNTATEVLQFQRKEGISGIRTSTLLEGKKNIKNKHINVELRPNITLAHYSYTGTNIPQSQAMQAITDINTTFSKSFIYQVNTFTLQTKPVFFIDYTTLQHNGTIVNEDSIANYINDSNVFSKSQYNGIDAVEEGFKLAYGLEFISKNLLNHQYKLLIAQRYNNHENLSNYVGKFSMKLEKFNANSRFIFDKKTNKPLLLNSHFTLTPSKSFQASIGYTYINASLQSNLQSAFTQNTSNVQTIENITYGINLKKNNSSFFLNITQNPQFKDFNNNQSNKVIMFSTGFGYQTNCLKYTVGIKQSIFIRNTELLRNNILLLEFSLFG